MHRVSKKALADISRSAHVVVATKLVHRLQIRPIVPYHSPSYIRVRAVVWECGDGQAERHADARDQYTFRLGYVASCEIYV